MDSVSGGTRRVLVVDDNHDSADSLKLLLQIWGHQAQCAYGSDEAMSAVEAFAPDVVLLDIGLPGMNGYDLAQRLRELPHGRSATLVAVTGYSRAEDRERSAAAGFEHHLVKPVDPAALEAFMRELPPRPRDG
jgi:CheY-like chemotaxis protein